MTPRESITIDAVFAGTVRPMPDDGRPTGIFKQPQSGAVTIGVEGLQGDVQADRRVHGGPEKALHHLPAEHYARYAAAFPDAAAQLVAGSLGENLSTHGWREEQVCIGDVFALGTARVQLSQPRTPCWKIDARHRVDGLAQLIDAEGIAGWYYRVLSPGAVQAGDRLQLIERHRDPLSLREYWTLKAMPRPPLERLRRLIATPGLAPAQAQRWQQRLQWLERNG